MIKATNYSYCSIFTVFLLSTFKVSSMFSQALKISHKVVAFYLIRVALALICSAAEIFFYRY
jgi:hypothetical protein